jgi:hypothetical protein
MTPIHIGKIYKHVKTDTKYRVLAVGKDVEDLKEYVVYEALYDNPVSKVWIREKESFVGEAKSPDGTFHPRFSLVEE